MANGKFITLEGIEGAGKSTAQQFIIKYLSKQGINATATREPGGTPLAEAIRHVLLYAKHDEPLFGETELLLMFASRAQHVRHHIMPLLASGQWVVSDRYVDASYAYQGGGRGIAKSFIQQLDHAIVGSCYPDVTFLLDIDPALGNLRLDARGNKKDRIEQEQLAFFKRVRASYLERAKAHPKRIVVIDASQSMSAVEERLQQVLETLIHTSS